jgi:hypothetical protein
MLPGRREKRLDLVQFEPRPLRLRRLQPPPLATSDVRLDVSELDRIVEHLREHLQRLVDARVVQRRHRHPPARRGVRLPPLLDRDESPVALCELRGLVRLHCRRRDLGGPEVGEVCEQVSA